MTRRIVATVSLVAVASCGELLSIGDPATAVPLPEAGTVDPVVEAGTDVTTPPPTDDGGTPGPKSFLEAVNALDGLVAHWRLDDAESSVAIDRIAENDGAYSGMTSAAPSLLVGDDAGSARRFIETYPKGGTVTLAKAGMKNGLRSLSTELTVGAIIKAANLPARRSVVVSERGVFELSVDGNVPKLRMPAGSAITEVIGAVTFTAHTTHLLVATFSTTTGKATLTVDGRRREGDRTQPASALSGALCIAGEDEGGCGSNAFDGVIDEVFVAEKAATEAQIAALLPFVKTGQ